MEDQHCVLDDAVNDDILSDSKTTQPGPQIGIAPASDVRMAGQQIKTIGDGIDEPVGDLKAGTSLAT